jgi:hypothetical protein
MKLLHVLGDEAAARVESLKRRSYRVLCVNLAFGCVGANSCCMVRRLARLLELVGWATRLV